MSKSGKKHQEQVAAEMQEAAASEAADETLTAAEEATAGDLPADTAGEDEAAAELDPLAAMTAERDEFKEKWLRLVAELDNVRKRSSRELLQSRKLAQADVLRGFLEVLDNFERALQSVPIETDTESPDSFREGVELIYQKIRGVLQDQGVVPMEALGAVFDPNFHEAVGQLEREGVESGIVIEVVQQGYLLGDMELRPARVIISA